MPDFGITDDADLCPVGAGGIGVLYFTVPPFVAEPDQGFQGGPLARSQARGEVDLCLVAVVVIVGLERGPALGDAAVPGAAAGDSIR